ncbi:MAG: type II toxin-antitoxin system VapC family toxin [Leptospirales bacterium]
MNIFLDSNICIYYLTGKYPVITENIKNNDPIRVKIPSLVKAELTVGALKSKRQTENLHIINTFLSYFEIIPFGNMESEIYAEVRASLETSGKIIGPNDLIIAATVMANNGILITNNEKEFKRVKNLRIENWVK